MKIYIVWSKNFHSEDVFEGVFSSRELAQKYIEKWDKCDPREMWIDEEFLDNF